jgi:serine/threonine protein kinase
MNETQISIAPDYEELALFVNTLCDRFEREGETIHKGRNEIKVFDCNGRLINVKRFRIPHLLNRIAYTFFRKPKAERSFAYAVKLRQAGVGTPDPVAFILEYKGGLLHYSYFVSLHITGYNTMYHTGKLPFEENKKIFATFARFTAELHENGIFHKDYSPGNILYKEIEGSTDFRLVDINRMKFGNVSIRKGCANFARLWGKEEVFRCIAREYAIARNADAEQCTQWVLHYRNKFWKRYATIPFEYE